MSAPDLPPAIRAPVVAGRCAFAVLACLCAAVAAQSPTPGFAAKESAEFAAAAGGSSLADALLVCLVYSAAIAALCFGAATAWALCQPTGSDCHAAVLTGAAAVSILLFWVVLSATLPEALRPLAFRNGMSVRADPDFHRDLDRLDEQLRQLASAGRR